MCTERAACGSPRLVFLSDRDGLCHNTPARNQSVLHFFLAIHTHIHTHTGNRVASSLWWMRGVQDACTQRRHRTAGGERGTRHRLSQAIKGPAWMPLCSFSKSPQLFTKGLAGAHRKRRGEMVAAVTAAATHTGALRNAAAQALRSAGLPPSFCANCAPGPRDFFKFSSHPGCVLLVCGGERRARAQRAAAALMARFASSCPPFIPPKISLSHGYIVTQNTRPLFGATEGPARLDQRRSQVQNAPFEPVNERPRVPIAAWQGSAA